ncbi:MAG: Deoxyguanosinetriphosphate triphosphohydrolase-like protein [Methanosaeta sp. PtaB.Bin039]|nr:MAG: Deoxyguanosinetriphosphate triphosphohydrolase-like protein [Methanosaeta sp. PtaB.Bin039]OPY45383.1 MAG: Deoxyguanosinetriphosphate triphosphohydrolase-like protein [Methanosaeta sp. PtaU1.Bin028]HOT06829.1 HD domain-containing protein [Methanotrichaceae archaeon]HQF16725.1 HD domain-containing protein [Methanotrichaceae archaeon]HQI91357.1 HD domain-containing protein [Methanotrichaceae archaeon]
MASSDRLNPVRDPVHGSVFPDRLESLFIASPPLQRLKGIRQLALVDMAYPGATHSRFEHSLGTMHVAGMMATKLSLSLEDVRLVRLAGLLHDIGHSAFSHAVELLLARNPDFQPIIGRDLISRHEQFTAHLLASREFPSQALEMVEQELGTSALDSVAAIIDGQSLPLGQLVSGDIDADRIDFLLRDSHHSGVSLGLVDLDQIMGALEVRDGRVVLAGDGDFRMDMSLTAAESLLVARAHHYSALIHHPNVQSARAMLLYCIEDVLKDSDPNDARKAVFQFFTKFNDGDLIAFLKARVRGSAARILEKLLLGQPLSLAARFGPRQISPKTRMALSTIARNGRMRQIFESGLQKRFGALVDLSTGSGVPRSLRTSDAFLYDESALAAGLTKHLTGQIAISFFSCQESASQIPLTEVDQLAGRLMDFMRDESYLSIDGLLLLFSSLHTMLCQDFGQRILVPRIRNITWIYRTVEELRTEFAEDLAGLFDYTFSNVFGFPYSERLFEDLQILVAVGMVYQDVRQYQVSGRWRQRYEYMLTSEGLAYSSRIVKRYSPEAGALDRWLSHRRHNIPYDLVSLDRRRYLEG